MNQPQRLISKNRYFVAAVITILIFLLGMALGAIIDGKRLDYLTQETKQLEIDYKSLQLQSMLLSDLKNNNNTCALIKTALDNSIETLHESLSRIENYQKDTKFNAEEYDTLSRRYIQDNIQYWQFAKQAKEQCDMNIVSVLYFYSTNYCPNCPDQGVLLTYFKKTLGENLLVFPIDIDLADKELLIKLLEANYNIDETPSIVVEETVFKGGVVQKDELGLIICAHFTKPIQGCEQISTENSANINNADGGTNVTEEKADSNSTEQKAEADRQIVFVS